jgi:hypothetical protein
MSGVLSSATPVYERCSLTHSHGPRAAQRPFQAEKLRATRPFTHRWSH